MCQLNLAGSYYLATPTAELHLFWRSKINVTESKKNKNIATVIKSWLLHHITVFNTTDNKCDNMGWTAEWVDDGLMWLVWISNSTECYPVIIIIILLLLLLFMHLNVCKFSNDAESEVLAVTRWVLMVYLKRWIFRRRHLKVSKVGKVFDYPVRLQHSSVQYYVNTFFKNKQLCPVEIFKKIISKWHVCIGGFWGAVF